MSDMIYILLLVCRRISPKTDLQVCHNLRVDFPVVVWDPFANRLHMAMSYRWKITCIVFSLIVALLNHYWSQDIDKTVITFCKRHIMFITSMFSIRKWCIYRILWKTSPGKPFNILMVWINCMTHIVWFYIMWAHGMQLGNNNRWFW